MTRATLSIGVVLTPEGLLAWVIVGLIAGFLTGFVMRKEGYRIALLKVRSVRIGFHGSSRLSQGA